RISRSCRRSSFSLRRRVSSLPTSSCGPSSKSLCSCSERHRLNVDLAMPRSFATRSTLRPLVSVSRTASRLNSFVNRLCLFLLIATSAIFHRGWLSTFAGQVHAASLVALAEDLEQQLGPSRRERHIAEFIDDQQLVAGELTLKAQQPFFVTRFEQFMDESRRRDEANR